MVSPLKPLTMKKTLLYILAVILLCGITASCSKNDDDNDVQEARKTIFLFYPYADNLTSNSFLQKDINEIKAAIETAGSMNGYRVLVYYGSSISQAELYEFKLQGKEVVKETIQQFSSAKQTDMQYLTNIFTLVKSTAPAKAYTMIVGGHGDGWIPSDIGWTSVAKNATEMKKSFGGTSYKDRRIDTDVFGSAMASADFHTDLTIFDCCYMGNIETIYDIHNNTDYVIATPAEEPANGLWFSDIWDDITSTTTNVSLTNICSKTLTYYDTNNDVYHVYGEPANLVNCICLSAIKCSEIDNIAMVMSGINSKYPETTGNIQRSIQRFDYKTTGVYYDLLDYVKFRLDGDTTNADYITLQNAISNAIVATACKGYYLANSSSCFPVKTFCGIATSDPSANTSIIDTKKQTSWWIATH